MPAPTEAFWWTGPGAGEIRPAPLPAPGPDEVLVATRFSGISRGTEALVARGGVPPGQHEVMAAPFQEGRFPWPVKYGYLSVGEVEQAPPTLRGRTVFCLYPHQTRYVVPAAAVTVLPDAVPAARALLLGTVETAVNAVWDAGPRLGDRIAVVGAGMVGCCVARLLAGTTAGRVQLVDVDPGRAAVAAALGVDFVIPADAAPECDLVVHASATDAGLACSLELLAAGGEVIELSWYGDRPVTVALGEAFHSRRLAVRSSQVGAVSPSARARYGHPERAALAADLLADPAFDALITDEVGFGELPTALPRIVAATDQLCVRVTYPATPGPDQEVPRCSN